VSWVNLLFPAIQQGQTARESHSIRTLTLTRLCRALPGEPYFLSSNFIGNRSFIVFKFNFQAEKLSLVQASLDRRRFLRQAGVLGITAAAGAAFAGKSAFAEEQESAGARQQEQAQAKDTATEIFTAALIAEDLATVFYYNVLVGSVMQDPNLAGTGGTATKVAADGNFGNVAYVRAALTEEIDHAKLFRSLLSIKSASKDPVQTFYFPADAFSKLSGFTALLDALENAFIGAYLNAIQEFATMAANARIRPHSERDRDDNMKTYTPEQLEYFAKVAASIMGIECEHRVLGRVLSNSNPANNLAYEQTDGLTAVYNGPHSAVVALTPFLTPSTGSGYSLRSALANQSLVSAPVSGAPPAY
jgi:hypothetical protein